jgi:hypothetical protein
MIFCLPIDEAGFLCGLSEFRYSKKLKRYVVRYSDATIWFGERGLPSCSCFSECIIIN